MPASITAKSFSTSINTDLISSNPVCDFQPFSVFVYSKIKVIEENLLHVLLI